MSAQLDWHGLTCARWDGALLADRHHYTVCHISRAEGAVRGPGRACCMRRACSTHRGSEQSLPGCLSAELDCVLLPTAWHAACILCVAWQPQWCGTGLLWLPATVCLLSLQSLCWQFRSGQCLRVAAVGCCKVLRLGHCCCLFKPGRLEHTLRCVPPHQPLVEVHGWPRQPAATIQGKRCHSSRLLQAPTWC